MLNKYFIFKLHTIRKLSTNSLNNKRWKSVVGLEVHAQIISESKLFSGSTTKFGAAANSSVSLFDAAIPGTLPVLNRRCVESGVRTALALGCKVNEVSMFDRKHYFYADMPAGYQITQQRAALANNGSLTFPVIVPGQKPYFKTSHLLQLQLEQDSGKTINDEEQKRNLIDLNRAGVPLMELVFAPDLETGEEAASLIKELILILRCLDTCSCRMEEGALRVDANISIHKEGEPFGVRTELKNISSIRSISQAVTYEINRQIEVVQSGGKISNETRSWDADLRQTITIRDKEVQQDYRFMPEPNLLPLHLQMKGEDKNNLVNVPNIKKNLPELPSETRNKLVEKYKTNSLTAALLVNEPKVLEYFFKIMHSSPEISAKLVTNFLLNDFISCCKKLNLAIDECKLDFRGLSGILWNLHKEYINLIAARSLLEMLHKDPTADITKLIEENDLSQITDLATIENLCKISIANNPKAVKKYKEGKSKALYAIAGEVEKLSKHKANMKLAVLCLEKLLKDTNNKSQV